MADAATGETREVRAGRCPDFVHCWLLCGSKSTRAYDTLFFFVRKAEGQLHPAGRRYDPPDRGACTRARPR